MTDPYASTEDSLAAMRPDTLTPAEKRLECMLEERWAYEQGSDYVGILRQIAVELIAQQPQARPDFTDEWTGYLKDGETPFERFMRERKDLGALTKLYQRALEGNERLKAQQPQAEAVPEMHDALCPALTGGDCTCTPPATIDKAWAQFCGGIGRGPDAPYPGMIEAFEAHYGQTFTDKDWREETGVWAAAWKAAKAHGEAAPQQAEAVPRDMCVMELAESVGLIGPASRTDDFHAAIQRFHDLVSMKVSIKAAVHFAQGLPKKGGAA